MVCRATLPVYFSSHCPCQSQCVYEYGDRSLRQCSPFILSIYSFIFHLKSLSVLILHSTGNISCLSLCLTITHYVSWHPSQMLSESNSTGIGTLQQGGQGGHAPHSGKKGGQHPIWPPQFSWFTSLSALPSVYQFISCHTLGSTALALVCVRGHFRVLENEKFSTLCEGEPLPHPPQLGRSAPSYVWPPTFTYVAMPMNSPTDLTLRGYYLY